MDIASAGYPPVIKINANVRAFDGARVLRFECSFTRYGLTRVADCSSLMTGRSRRTPAYMPREASSVNSPLSEMERNAARSCALRLRTAA